MKPTVFPELIPRVQRTRKPWTIYETHEPNGRVDIAKQVLFVPFDPDDYTQTVQAHELAHIRFSPKSPERLAKRHNVQLDTLQNFENYRINRWIGKVLYDQDVTGHHLTPPTILTALHDQMKSTFQKAPPPTKYNILRQLALQRIHAANFADRYQTNQLLDELTESSAFRESLTPIIRHMHQGKNQTNQIIPLKRIIEAAQMFDRLLPKEQPKVGNPNFNGFDYEDLKGGWGKMHILEPPRTRSPKFKPIKRYVHSDMGTNIRSLSRVISDQKVFASKQYQEGGTVLIDNSGSMSLDHEQIVEMVKHAPSATVALYSGRRSDGDLKILVKGGKTVSPSEYDTDGGGNIIDGPALLWLSKQAEPRLWVSDGHVTGINEQRNIHCADEAREICKNANIMRVDHAIQAIETFKKMRQHKFRPKKTPARKQF